MLSFSTKILIKTHFLMKQTMRCHRAVLIKCRLKVSHILISSLAQQGTSCCFPCPSYFFWPFCVCVYSDCLCPHHWPSCCFCRCCWGHRWQSRYRSVIGHFFSDYKYVNVCVSLLDLYDFCHPPLLSPCFLFLHRSFSPLNFSKVGCLCPRSVVSLCLMRSSQLKNTIHICRVFFFLFAIDDTRGF